jgi:pimeloyl-ACP methyl ester carboxylesterase
MASGAAAPLAIGSGARAADSAVDERGFIPIGGIDQWIAVQGRDRAKPLILFLHGGPGQANSPFLADFIPWEADFIVANWDQRGAGRTYGRNGSTTPDMTIERMTADAIEVAEHLRARFSKRKIVLVGHSWGAMLGLAVAERRPELFHAFVGTGQGVDWVAGLESQERWAREQATAAGDSATLKALDATAGLPASDPRRVQAPGRWVLSAADAACLKMRSGALGGASPADAGNAADYRAGMGFSASSLLPAISRFDARKVGLNLAVPYVVIQGRDDHITPFDLARAFVEDVRAPHKAFVPIDGGHLACFTNPDGFVGALRTNLPRRID